MPIYKTNYSYIQEQLCLYARLSLSLDQIERKEFRAYIAIGAILWAPKWVLSLLA